ncbi:MAG: methyltransferase domain-containing protein, partial [Armatimonadetes bacterium]|nr:methyltransferase domain-containing protein [Armatimonadota bacterium]
HDKSFFRVVSNIEDLGLKQSMFHNILVLDVLEHVNDDKKAIENLYCALKPGGRVILTVPMFPSMWSLHDKYLGHKRRYTKKQLTRLIKGKFSVLKAGYWNSILFPLIFCFRFLRRFHDNLTIRSDVVVYPNIINKILLNILRFENFLIRRGVRLPIRVTYFMVLQKKRYNA